jgi:hypothetical protein
LLGPGAEVDYGLLGEIADEVGADAKAKGLIARPGIRMGGNYALPGGSATAIWASSCQVPQYQIICNEEISRMGPHAAATPALINQNGRLTLPAVLPGVYYVVARTGYNNTVLVWNVRIQLRPEENTVTLDERNATRVN